MKRSSPRLVNLAKKVLMTGLGAVAMTEEGVRSFLSDMKLPKEAANYILEAAENRKQELLEIVRGEIHRFLEGLNIAGEIEKVLSRCEIDVAATIKLRPSGKADVHLKRIRVKEG